MLQRRGSSIGRGTRRRSQGALRNSSGATLPANGLSSLSRSGVPAIRRLYAKSFTAAMMAGAWFPLRPSELIRVDQAPQQTAFPFPCRRLRRARSPNPRRNGSQNTSPRRAQQQTSAKMWKRHPHAGNPSFYNVSRFFPRATIRPRAHLDSGEGATDHALLARGVQTRTGQGSWSFKKATRNNLSNGRSGLSKTEGGKDSGKKRTDRRGSSVWFNAAFVHYRAACPQQCLYSESATVRE